ncbi:hypothetical protein ACFSQQ_09710 [Mesorhizobium kowhaii]|uniref:hypothetical protein n=1 Tax=Mesorhizobium kowhaii TaxID=1300272 RepID=UPI0035EA2B9D
MAARIFCGRKATCVANKVNVRAVCVDFARDANYLGYSQELSHNPHADTIRVRSGWGEKELQE